MDKDLKGNVPTNKLVIGLTTVFVVFLVIASFVSIYNEGAFFIPGLAPVGYKPGQEIDLYVNKITSSNSPLPFRYHDLPVCTPAEEQPVSENLGEVLTGNRKEKSVYKIEMLNSVECAMLCSKTLDMSQITNLKGLIEDEYIVQWELDGLPAAMRGVNEKTGQEVWESGFFLGSYEKQGDKSIAYLNNHVHLTIYHHEHAFDSKSEQSVDQSPHFNVVMFEVQPSSVAYTDPANWKATCTKALSGSQEIRPVALLDSQTEQKVIYTYSVSWKPDLHTDWAHRWHKYLTISSEGQIHWFSITNSVLIVFFLSGMVAMILARTVRRDFAKYLEEDKDEVEETGWKLINGDVFRPPQRKSFFALLVGSGVQVFWMSVVTMVFAVLGFLAPSNQGAVTTAILVLYVWMGAAAGYSSSRIYQMFEGERHTFNTLLTALVFPGTIFGIVFFLNFFMWAKGSSGAFPWTTIVGVIALWLCISVPLCFLGSRLAYRRPPPKNPGNVTQIPRQIPTQKWYMNPILTILMGGILPFGAIFIELYFVLSSIWQHSYYALFGFLFLVFLILVITCAEISVVMTYFQLCSEDWHWWWRSFLTSGSSALYMLLYSTYYFSRLKVHGFIPTLLYFGYSLILCLFFFVLTGTIGFYASYYFVKRLYYAIHQD